jgi:hypothetical protein
METAKRTVILLILVLLITGTVQSAEKPAKEKISNTRFASCVVKITANPVLFPLNYEAVESLLRSSRIAGRAGRDVLGLPPERSVEFFRIEPLSREAGGAIPPEPGREPQRMGDDMMMGERMMRNEQRMMEDRSMYDEMTDESTRATSRRGRTESRIARGRTDRDIGLYGEEARRPRVAAPVPPPGPDVEQTLLFRLTVKLPEDVKPAAEEFMNVLVDLMRRAMLDNARDYSIALQNRLSRIREQRDKAQSQLSKIMEQARAIEPPPPIKLDPADAAVYEQLDQIVDLSMLSPTMPFGEAIEKLKNSIDPPLKLVVLWRDLLENIKVEPTTEINMDGIPQVRLGTALELLLKAISDGFTELGYVVKNGVITVATKDALPNNLETRVYDIPGLGYPGGGTDNLIQLIQDTIEPDSWYDTGGQGTISTYMGRKLAILQTPEIHRKIQDFLQTIKVDIPVDVPMDVPLEPLLDEKNNLFREKRDLEMDIARLEARHTATEEQIARIGDQTTTRVKDDAVIMELQRLLDTQTQQLENIKKLVDTGKAQAANLNDAEEKTAKTRIELAKRREELGQSIGGDQLVRFNNELAGMMIDLAEKRAVLGVVDKQLKQTEGQLATAATFDPQVSQIRIAKQALEITSRRVNELETLLAGLQEPTVTVLGVD